MSTKKIVKNLFHSFGLDIHRYSPEINNFGRFLSALKTFNINTVIDVGANEGQFGESLRNAGYDGEIISFEPLTSAYTKLLEISEKDKNWHVHSRSAIGEDIGEIKLNISNNSVSSSVLPMLESHSLAAPESIYVGQDSCALLTLDSVIHSYVVDESEILLKIDTQGYEWEVLNGASTIMPKVQGVLIEMSLVPLYEGQKLWGDIISRLETEGFILWSLQPAFTDPKNGRTLQVDGLFFRA